MYRNLFYVTGSKDYESLVLLFFFRTVTCAWQFKD